MVVGITTQGVLVIRLQLPHPKETMVALEHYLPQIMVPAAGVERVPQVLPEAARREVMVGMEPLRLSQARL